MIVDVVITLLWSLTLIITYYSRIYLELDICINTLRTTGLGPEILIRHRQNTRGI